MTQTHQQILDTLAAADECYQQLLMQCTEAEKDYLRIKAGLSDLEQQQLDRYISLCEELEHLRTCLACEMLLTK